MKETASLWAATASSTAPHYPRLDTNLEVDVAIVGGGITGITAAHLLATSGKRVALFEARRLGSGVSGGSSVQLTEALDTRYHQIASDFGAEGAALAARATREAIEYVAGLTERGAIDCGFLRRPGFLYTEKQEDVAELEKEFEAAARAGVNVELVARAPLPFENRAAIRFDGQAQMHIVHYLAGLANLATTAGARLYEETRIIAIDDGSTCTLHVENGPEVRAAKVLVATHAPLNRVFLQTKIHAYRSYVLAFPNVALSDGLFFDTSDPYHYFSSFSINGAPHLIVGGEDHKTGTKVETEERLASLLEWSRAHFAVVGEPSHQWSAQVEEPVDGLPYIGRNSLSENVYVATGYSGNGITFGTAAAQIVADLVAGKENPYAELFSATRLKPIAAAKEFTTENIDFPLHFVSDRLHPVDVKNVAEIAAGEGKTVRVEGERLAVYRDGGGTLHAVSSVCTHLGCLVKWNASATSWDCPCHGSRFDIDGEVLDGPAVRALAKRSVES